MTHAHKRPLLLFVFANDRVADGSGYLRNLPAERRRLQACFPAEGDRPFDVLFEANVTPDGLRALLDQHHERLVAFHYGGHATASGLSLETDDGRPDVLRVEGFAGELAALPNLAFVFLNGCCTAGHVDALRVAGGENGPLVVATEWAIRDDVATAFAERFYRNLSLGRTLAEAFGKAEDQQRGHLVAPGDAREDGLASQRIDSVGCLDDLPHRMLRPAAEPVTDAGWPWALFLPPSRPEAMDWRLPDAEAARSPRLVGLWVFAGVVLAVAAIAIYLHVGRLPSGPNTGGADAAAPAPTPAMLDSRPRPVPAPVEPDVDPPVPAPVAPDSDPPPAPEPEPEPEAKPDDRDSSPSPKKDAETSKRDKMRKLLPKPEK